MRWTRNCTRFVIALLTAAPFALAQRGAPIEQQLTFAPYHASGIYELGETVGWTVTPGPVTPKYNYKWTIRPPVSGPRSTRSPVPKNRCP